MSVNATCIDMDTAAYLRGVLTQDPAVPSYPCPRIVFPSGAIGTLSVSITSPTRAVVMVQPDYEPRVEDTHAADVASIREAVDALNAEAPVRFGRPLGKVTVTFQQGAQYTLTKDDADWINGVIGAVCPVVKRWVGCGGEWCLSHEVDPTAVALDAPRGEGR